MYELAAIVPAVVVASLNALAILWGHEGSSLVHQKAFAWGLAALFALPLLILALASSMLSLFNPGTGLASVFAGVLGLVVLYRTVVAVINMVRLHHNRSAA